MDRDDWFGLCGFVLFLICIAALFFWLVSLTEWHEFRRTFVCTTGNTNAAEEQFQCMRYERKT